MGQRNSHPEPGDLIEIDRPFHQHWALYVGDGYVINLTPVGKRRAAALGLHTLPEYIRKVEKQLLKDVVGNNEWHINNESDQYCSPLPVEEIIRCAEHSIGREVTFHVFGSNCERFVKTLRYGDQKNFVHGEMHFPEIARGSCHPSPGDLIEIKWGLYQHWALYVGNGYVIHVTPVDENAPPVPASTVTLSTGKVKVKKELLTKVAGNDEWHVNNKFDWYCAPLPEDKIIQRAEGYIDKEVPYDYIRNSSEHFVEKLRYGGQRKTFIPGEMRIPEMAHGMCYPKPGDLIEIKQPIQHHWALYMGDGYVIHVTSADENALHLSASTVTILTRKVKVKKQLLNEVVGNDEWCVNNKYDWYRTPLPVEEIIWRAEQWIDREVPYEEFGRKCGHFVKRFRYVDQVRNFVCGEMNIPEMVQDRHDPNPGDLIEIKEPDLHHWALYMGDGYVIHVTSVDENAPPVSASTVTLFTGKVKVKKELLTKVVGNDEWHVNNKYDWFHTPLPNKVIIKLAEGYIDKEVPYDFIRNSGERFVKKLRYGGELGNFLCREILPCAMAQDMTYPNPGDLIEIKRTGYQHWALYVGKGYVIHVTGVGENAPALSSSTVTILTRKAKVKKELLMKVVENANWYVNNKYDLKRCPYPVEEILQRAERWIDKEVPYRLLLSNCEHFVTMLRYGERFSDQVLKALARCSTISGAAGIGLAGACFLSTSPFLLAAASVDLFANIGLISSTLRHISTQLKFLSSGRDILEQMCC